MTTTPEPAKASLRRQLTDHAKAHWPQLADLDIRHRAGFAYIAGKLPDGTTMPLLRLRYHGSARLWGFAIYLASKDKYEESFLPSGNHTGTPQKPSTAPAASTSTTPQPGCHGYPRRINGRDH